VADGTPVRLVSLDGDDRTVRVVLSDGSELELAADSLPPALPVPGESLAPETEAALRAAAARKTAARLVFEMLDRRLHTRRDLQRKLTDRGIDPESAAAVLDMFEAQGLHSDRHYAEAWCRDTVRTKAVGRRFLEAKLREKGVAAGVAAAVAADALDDADEREAADRAARSWWRRRGGDPHDPRTLAKGVRFLTGRGFPPGLAQSAVRAAAAADGEE